MFDLLKNKLSSFGKKIIKSTEENEKRTLSPDISVSSKAKSLITGEIEIKEKDIEDLLFEFELLLLEADVNEETTKKLVQKISEKIVGKKFARKNLKETINKEIKSALKELIQLEPINLLKEINSKKEKPFKILFLGPNGAGKTTSIAKLANHLQKQKLKIILSASDTFRAASIEQLEKHSQNLNLRLIKHKYGSDPSAVAFDAIESAKASKTDIVLIDSAGRQETNKNLMEELKKMHRVIKPDLTLFVGESLSGKTLLEQAKQFNEAGTINGFILTKIDTDTKGGTIISLLSELKKPILFVGTGQEYKDFQKFDENFLIERIF